MKIAFVTNEYPPHPHGGIGSFVQAVARELVRCGHTVSVVGTYPLASIEDDLGVRVIRLRRRTGPLAGLAMRKAMYRWIQNEFRAGRIDIVETAEFGGLLPWSLPGIPVVVRLHLSQSIIDHYAGTKSRFITRYLERSTLAKHRCWIGVSNFALLETTRILNVEPAWHRVIYNPAEVSQATNATETTAVPTYPFVLFAGTVSERKGALHLALAANDFLELHPDVHLVYVGVVAIERRANIGVKIMESVKPHLRHRVHLMGRQSKAYVFNCMSKCRVFAFPSTLEFFGMVIGEAMLASAPVVVLNRPPMNELVVNNVSGLLVELDEPASLSEAINRVLDDPAFGHQLGEAAHNAASSQFTIRATVENSLNAYQQIINAAYVQ
jgi:glycosyltransferase involved in cell wall biosynthesis